MLSVPLPGQVDAVTVSFVQEATFPGVPAKPELALWQSGRRPLSPAFPPHAPLEQCPWGLLSLDGQTHRPSGLRAGASGCRRESACTFPRPSPPRPPAAGKEVPFALTCGSVIGDVVLRPALTTW